MKRIKDDVFVYAEGGGEGALAAEMRQAFAEFLGKTALGAARRPRVVPCGSRTDALHSFTTAIKQGRNALLLVDSEVPVAGLDQPWAHLAKSDGWPTPESADDRDCHLMVQCMETWFLADWRSLSSFYGQGFNEKLKRPLGVESVSKQEVLNLLARATKDCKTKAKSSYIKANHSFKLMSLVSAEAVCAASPWARRFVEELLRRKP